MNPLILEAFSVHFGSSGVNDDPLNHLVPPPIGAFALTISAVCFVGSPVLLCHSEFIQVERALECWRNGRVSKVGEFSRGNWGASTAEYIRGLKKISNTRWSKILSETQQFTPYKPCEASASPNDNENYRTKAPDSGKPSNWI